eukprot:gnl/Ergobibamus_cyprinoides/3763.p1 GENE.gnl/Ergobibamus_cyprinoides/3763~~gnl/Ergobibamus_cyprinoides/3763.p1  ORF type:complete len:223 (+),score=80.23 gnl/Ergobibamus_cyprinoides/3763:101-769(+)
MSSLWTEYQHDFESFLTELRDKVKLITSCSADERRVAIQKAAADVQEIEECLAAMSAELRNLSASQRVSSQQTLKRFQDEFRHTNAELTSLVQAADRDALMTAEHRVEVSALDARQRMLDSAARLDRTTDRLEDTHRTALETEQIGAQILEDLDGQRRTMLGSMDKNRAISSKLDQARNLTRRMHRREVAQRVVLWIVLILLILACAGIIYAKYFYVKPVQE